MSKSKRKRNKEKIELVLDKAPIKEKYKNDIVVINDLLIERIENRATADCNTARLLEHRDCNHCHLFWDCKVYQESKGKTLCNLVDELNK